jgi:hypothetical protein
VAAEFYRTRNVFQRLPLQKRGTMRHPPVFTGFLVREIIPRSPNPSCDIRYLQLGFWHSWSTLG